MSRTEFLESGGSVCMMDFKTYHALPEEAVFIRETVFVKEQGFAEELDDIDAIATHIVLYNKESMPVATCRYFWDKELNAWVVGRIAVLKEFREKHYGTAVLHEAERQIRENGAEKVCLAAQVRAKGFYEKIGYFAIGDEFLEEHCPHIRMCKNLKGQD